MMRGEAISTIELALGLLRPLQYAFNSIQPAVGMPMTYHPVCYLSTGYELQFVVPQTRFSFQLQSLRFFLLLFCGKK
ncbi:MAG: hypothetical protein KF746_25485 [Chitinophagaceae bacterium]|nr:hypothetical protein [Chitinophagaceae bacterium]